MTYIVGCKKGDWAFLTADSAVTTTSPDAATIAAHAQRPATSAFGEARVRERNRIVGDDMFKVIDFRTLALAVTTSDLSRAASFLQVVEERIDAKDEPTDALRAAVESIAPITGWTIGVIAVIPGRPARLLSFQSGTTNGFVEHTGDKAIQLGSAPSPQRVAAEAYVTLLQKLDFSPRRFLASLIAALQGFGQYDYLMEHGVGGAIAGIAAGPDGLVWQDDTLYVSMDSKGEIRHAILVAVRDRGLKLVTREESFSLINYFSKPDIDAWRTRWHPMNATEWYAECPPEFVVFFSPNVHDVVVVEMLGSWISGELVITSRDIDHERRNTSAHPRERVRRRFMHNGPAPNYALIFFPHEPVDGPRPPENFPPQSIRPDGVASVAGFWDRVKRSIILEVAAPLRRGPGFQPMPPRRE